MVATTNDCICDLWCVLLFLVNIWSECDLYFHVVSARFSLTQEYKHTHTHTTHKYALIPQTLSQTHTCIKGGVKYKSNSQGRCTRHDTIHTHTHNTFHCIVECKMRRREYTCSLFREYWMCVRMCMVLVVPRLPNICGSVAHYSSADTWISYICVIGCVCVYVCVLLNTTNLYIQIECTSVHSPQAL